MDRITSRFGAVAIMRTGGLEKTKVLKDQLLVDVNLNLIGFRNP
ncbi:MAG: hypothetical protein WAT22_01775 [Saprospiraceae bacterium]